MELHFHFAGEINNTDAKYVGGRRVYLRDADLDAFSCMEIRRVFFSLGYRYLRSLYYNYTNDLWKMNELKSEDRYMEMVCNLCDRTEIHIFAEHQDENVSVIQDYIDLSFVDGSCTFDLLEWVESDPILNMVTPQEEFGTEFVESDGEDVDDLFCEDSGNNDKVNMVRGWDIDLFTGPINLEDFNIPDPLVDSDSDHLHTPVNSDNEDVREKCREFNPLTNYEKRTLTLKVGDLFPSFKDYITYLVEYAIQEGFDYYYSKNEKNLIVATCKGKACKWTVRASTCSRTWGFRVKTIRFQHTFVRNYESTKVTSSWLAKRNMSNVRDDPNGRLSAFVNDVERNIKVSVSRQKCYRAKRQILQSVYGKEEDQYMMIRDYGLALMQSNPGTSAIVDLDDGRFRRFYICFKACKSGFIKACRSLITLDGGHLKGLFGGQLLCAVGWDANNNMYPIAFAIVESENKRSWKWFLDRLIDDLGTVEQHGWSFIADQQKGLIESFKELMPWAHTRICVRHLYENFKKEFKGKVLKDYLGMRQGHQ